MCPDEGRSWEKGAGHELMHNMLKTVSYELSSNGL
jgi:hypothetical protein